MFELVAGYILGVVTMYLALEIKNKELNKLIQGTRDLMERVNRRMEALDDSKE